MPKTFPLKPLLKPLSDLEKLMQSCSCPWMIIGGVAVSLLAEPRFTADVDVVILIEDVHFDRMFKSLEEYGFEPRLPKALEFARQNRVLLLKHIQSGISLDVSLGALPFEQEALKRSRPHKVGKITLRLPTIEDLIIFKSVAHRSKDLWDIQELISLSGRRLDRKYITKYLNEFAEVLDRPEIVNDVKKMFCGQFKK